MRLKGESTGSVLQVGEGGGVCEQDRSVGSRGQAGGGAGGKRPHWQALNEKAIIGAPGRNQVCQDQGRSGEEGSMS